MADTPGQVQIQQIAAAAAGAGTAVFGLSKGRVHMYDWDRKMWIPLSTRVMSLSDAGVTG
jgi:hypothetical protein